MPNAQKLDPDVEAFYRELLDSGELSDAERDLLGSLLGKEVIQNKFKSGIHAKRRFNQEMDRVKREKGEFEKAYNDKLSQLDSLRDTLAHTSSAEKQQVANLQQAVRQAEAERQRIIQVARGYAGGDEFLREAGLNENAGSATAFVHPTHAATMPQNGKPEFSKEDLLKELSQKLGGQIADNTRAVANWTVDLRKIERDYHSLTGKDLDLDEFRQAVTEDDSGDYWKVYNERYDIPRLKAQKSEEALRARLEKEIRDEYDRKYMSQSLPRERQVQSSDFYKAIDASIPETERNGSPQAMPNHKEVVNEATAYFNKLREAKEARDGT